MTPPGLLIRLARVADLQRINDIYNYYVLHSECTYQVEPSTYQERATWFAEHGSNYPVTVGEQDGAIVAWGSLSRFHPRSAYSKTVENSVYVQPELHRHGIGSAMLIDLLVRAKALGHHTALALIDTKQAGSIAMHKRYGFDQAAYLKEVGYKFGQWLDVVYLQKMLI